MFVRILVYLAWDISSFFQDNCFNVMSVWQSPHKHFFFRNQLRYIIEKIKTIMKSCDDDADLPAGLKRATRHARTSWSRQLIDAYQSGHYHMPKQSEDVTSVKDVKPTQKRTCNDKINFLSERRYGITSLPVLLREIDAIRVAAGHQKRTIDFDEVEYRHHVSEVQKVNPANPVLDSSAAAPAEEEVAPAQEGPKNQETFLHHTYRRFGSRQQKLATSHIKEGAKQSLISKLDDTFRNKLGNVLKRKRSKRGPADFATAAMIPSDGVLNCCTPVTFAEAAAEQGPCRLFRLDKRCLPLQNEAPEEDKAHQQVWTENENVLADRQSPKVQKSVTEKDDSDEWETLEIIDCNLPTCFTTTTSKKKRGSRQTRRSCDQGSAQELTLKSELTSKRNKNSLAKATSVMLNQSREDFYPSVSEVISAFDNQMPVSRIMSKSPSNSQTLDRLKISHWQRKNDYLTAAGKKDTSVSKENVILPKKELNAIDAAKAKKINPTPFHEKHKDEQSTSTYTTHTTCENNPRMVTRYSELHSPQWNAVVQQIENTNKTLDNLPLQYDDTENLHDAVDNPSSPDLELVIEVRDSNVKDRSSFYVVQCSK